MTTRRELEVEGMTCEHCAATLRAVLLKVPGVREADASYSGKRAWVVAEASVPDKELVAAAASKGYRARAIAQTPASAEATHRSTGGDASFDLVIIGSGGAAFGAALRASELGAKVAMVERGTLGGTCVNIGCVPSKTLIRGAESLHRAQRTAFDGVAVQGRLTDFTRLMEQNDDLVRELRTAKYARVLESTPNVRLVAGHGTFVRPGELQVTDDSGRSQVLHSDRFLIATGMRPHAADIPGLTESGYLTSTTALSLRKQPASLVVLGGRYVALELAQAFGRLGTRITIVQRSDHVLPTEDDDVTDALAAYLREEGIEVLTGAHTRRVARDDRGVAVEVDLGSQGTRLLHAEQILAATGRRANTHDLGLEHIGVALGADGTIVVDEMLRTSVRGVYAAGDVVGEPAFVYTAAYGGKLAAENALGAEQRRVDYTALPWVVFTDPQIAAVGLNERRAREAGIDVDVSRLPMSSVPRALAARDTRGFIKLIKERGGDWLLGATILAPEAGDLVMEPALAIRHGIPVSALASAFHPYLTSAEGIKLAAQAFGKDVAKLSCCAA